MKEKNPDGKSHPKLPKVQENNQNDNFSTQIMKYTIIPTNQ